MAQIPDVVPDEIAELIYRNWGDIKAFSDAHGLKYSTVHSVLCRSNHSALDKIERLAGSLKISTEQLAEILDALDKEKLTKLIQESEFGTYKNLAAHIGVTPHYLHGLFNSGVIKNAHLQNVRQVSAALGMSLSKFRELYNFAKAS